MGAALLQSENQETVNNSKPFKLSSIEKDDIIEIAFGNIRIKAIIEYLTDYSFILGKCHNTIIPKSSLEQHHLQDVIERGTLILDVPGTKAKVAFDARFDATTNTISVLNCTFGNIPINTYKTTITYVYKHKTKEFIYNKAFYT